MYSKQNSAWTFLVGLVGLKPAPNYFRLVIILVWRTRSNRGLFLMFVERYVEMMAPFERFTEVHGKLKQLVITLCKHHKCGDGPASQPVNRWIDESMQGTFSSSSDSWPVNIYRLQFTWIDHRHIIISSLHHIVISSYQSTSPLSSSLVFPFCTPKNEQYLNPYRSQSPCRESSKVCGIHWRQILYHALPMTCFLVFTSEKWRRIAFSVSFTSNLATQFLIESALICPLTLSSPWLEPAKHSRDYTRLLYLCNGMSIVY